MKCGEEEMPLRGEGDKKRREAASDSSQIRAPCVASAAVGTEEEDD